jgi:uncharacterized protein YbbK (DUF523 family)
MERVLVSACLLGEPVRYNGADKRCDHEILQRWLRDGRVVQICPEVAGGLSVPRPPAEIANRAPGQAVLEGVARVMDINRNDVSVYFVRGAEEAFASARANGIRVAVLKDGSPSCGTNFTYDGTFTSTKVSNLGVTAALLQQDGVNVFGEGQFVEADTLLRRIEFERSPKPSQ